MKRRKYDAKRRNVCMVALATHKYAGAPGEGISLTMDWDYLLSVSPEDLTEEEKDDLYNTVTWFSCDSERLDLKKAMQLLRVSQEVLKYKGEQVEILVHKLDELATQQGEEEVRRLESDTDGRSSKSKKSGSLEFENLEQKYIELKSKYKKQVRSNEKNSSEMNKLQKQIANLEQEKNRLLNEMATHQDDSQSEASESARDQQKELVESLHNKNRHITELLRDIEETEKENIVLREKMASVRDELSSATKELTTLAENEDALRTQLEKSSEMVSKLTVEKEHLQDEMNEALNQKSRFEEEMESFTEQVNERVDEWKRILAEKEKEITDLRSRQIQQSHHSSRTSLVQDTEDGQAHYVALNKVLAARENQLSEVKTRLQEAVEEMEESTVIIQDLTEERDKKTVTISELSESVTELKKKLKSVHERCQSLQEDLTHAEKVSHKKDVEIQEIITNLKNDGYTDTATTIQEIHQLKVQIGAQEKHIMNLVKASNHLQDMCDQYEKENELLRARLGISSDEVFTTADIASKQKQNKRELHHLKKQIELLQEEKVRWKLENHKLKGTSSKRESSEVQDEHISSKNQLKALVEENEALRKGMHEILDSLNNRKESTLKEVKSETFQKLLRALDIKHISGWYHPAMRLQAELHNLEGINSELREQLRLARIETQRKEPKIAETPIESSNFLSLLGVSDFESFSGIHNTLQNLFLRLEQAEKDDDEIESKLLTYKNNFEQIRVQIGVLYEEYSKEKQLFVDKMSEYEEKISDLSESNAVETEKVNLLLKDCPNEASLVSRSLELAENNVILIRKRTYLENECKRLTEQVSNLQKDQSQAQSACLRKINDLTNKNKVLSIEIASLSKKIDSSIDPVEYKTMRTNLENTTMKYRQLLSDFNKSTQDREFQTKIMEENWRSLRQDTKELQSKIVETREKLHVCQCDSNESIDDKVRKLSKELSLSESNEISERQRANHTNNLYELVKEQLQKSDERHKQVEKYSNELLQKNLVLQEQVKDTENKLIDSIDVSIHQNLQSTLNDITQENEHLKAALCEQKQEVAAIRKSGELSSFWNDAKAQEMLDLKHQIVDLQAVSDEKVQIARLSADLSHARLHEAENVKKIADLNLQLEELNSKYWEATQELQRKSAANSHRESEFKRKISTQRELLGKLKLRFLGCVPLYSEEKFVDNIKQAVHDKHEAFMNVYNSQILTNESFILKERYESELRLLQSNISDPDRDHQERKHLQYNEIKYRRQSELKNTQLQHVFDRVKIQDEQIIKLEEELFALNRNVSFDLDLESLPVLKTLCEEKPMKADPVPVAKFASRDTQTEVVTTESKSDGEISKNVHSELAEKEQINQQLKTKLNEHEMSISLFRKQLGDKQSQITFYERHILELQSKKDISSTSESIEANTNEEIITLKCSLKMLQDNVKHREEDILKYQSLLKEDRDKHSMAASLMREELQMLQKSLNEEKHKYLELQSTITNVQPSKVALEQYFIQVHSLEDELSDLRTQASGLESQLQASRQESVRWRTLANDRLESMQKLGYDLEEVHCNEIVAYKNEAEKWREEVTTLKLLVSKCRTEMGHDFDFQKVVKERDDKIHDLSLMLRQTKTELKRQEDRTETDSKLSELESTRDLLLKEHEIMKRKFDLLLAREKSAREEIRELKGKLMKKPILSARSDRSDKTVRDQLQKKISSLEDEIVELKGSLAHQISMNESHRIKIAEDFDRWNKQKHLQQTIDKLKTKLKAKETDFEKLQDTCAGYRILIERLEREKYNLESRNRTLKSDKHHYRNDENELLRLENMRLISENQALSSKLEMQQMHAGGLGAAMLQEKLEGQERKIAILELSAKGTAEVRTELERLQNSVSTLQKSNLCLEAENLELKLDLEKSTKEVPHLRQQIQHLENYIDVLKKERASQETPDLSNPKSDTKKVSELERTVFVLKRVIEKLQIENKRLLTGKRPYSDRSLGDDKLNRDHQRLKEQYCDSIQKVGRLEQELKALTADQNKPVSDHMIVDDELAEVKEQLEQKSQLLNKVKLLLQRAATKEKTLLDEIRQLKLQSKDV